jgi:hypothetical protein
MREPSVSNYITGLNAIHILPSLAMLAHDKYETAASKFWRQPESVDSIQLTYDSALDDSCALCDVICTISVRHLLELSELGRFSGLAQTNSRFAFDIVIAQARILNGMVKKEC